MLRSDCVLEAGDGVSVFKLKLFTTQSEFIADGLDDPIVKFSILSMHADGICKCRENGMWVVRVVNDEILRIRTDGAISLGDTVTRGVVATVEIARDF